MFDKLDFILEKYEELSLKVSDPDVINNQKLWQKHIKEMGEMEPIVNKYREYKKAKEAVAEAKEMLDSGDEELRELAKMEIAEYEEQLPQLEEQLKILLLPKDPNDDKNVILEVRAGTGGEVVEFKHAHGAVPHHGARALHSGAEGGDGVRADVHALPAVGDGHGADHLPVGVVGEIVGGHSVGG